MREFIIMLHVKILIASQKVNITIRIKQKKNYGRILNELTRYMYEMEFEIIVSNFTITKDIQEIDKAIQKLKLQENKLVDLYLNSNLSVETINNKNDSIKKEIENLNKKKQKIDPNNVLKEYVIELSNKLEGTTNNQNVAKDKLYMDSFLDT